MQQTTHLYKNNTAIAIVLFAALVGNHAYAGNKSYATVGMMNNNGTLCTTHNKHCGLFVSQATMNGAGAREDGGQVGQNGLETARLICNEEGALTDGGTHTWRPWLSANGYSALTATQLMSSGARYYRAGSATFVLNQRAISQKPPNVNRLGAPLDGAVGSYWSGTDRDGSPMFENCVNWTSADGAAVGIVGSRQLTDGQWSAADNPACSLFFPVLCLQLVSDGPPQAKI